MELKFRCGHCQRRLEADANMAGTTLPCPSCGFDLTVPEAHVGPGVTLGGFRIEARLGKGAMGEVFLATQLAVDRSVALKVFPGRVVADSAFVDRFFQEVRMAARLEHPNIVTAYDAGQDHGYYFFAMAYVDGEALSERLLRAGPMAEKDVLRICGKIAGALCHAWAHGKVLHRDVKPSNIMIDRAGEPLIMDMGIAKSIHDDSHLTATGIAMGTPHYMSPEQARGSGDLDFRTDMYSLGATMFQLMGGEVPFKGNSAMEVVAKHMHDPLPPIRQLAPGISQVCDDLLHRMMEKDISKRYPSWDACIKDMDLVRRGKAPFTARMKVARQASQSLVAQRQYVGGSRMEESGKPRRSPGLSWSVPAIAMLVAGVLLGVTLGIVALTMIIQRLPSRAREQAGYARVRPAAAAAAAAGGQQPDATEMADSAAADAFFLDVLKSTLNSDFPGDRQGLERALRKRLLSRSCQEFLEDRLDRYRERYGDTPVGRRRVAFLENVLCYPFAGFDWRVPGLDLSFVWVPSMDGWVGKYEVTNAQFRAQVERHHSGGIHGVDLNAADAPAVSVNFAAARSFAAFVHEREMQAERLPAGYRYRLPTRDEWTALAQCDDKRNYPWGKTWPPPATVNYSGMECPVPENRQIASRSDPFPGTCPVNQSGINGFGLYGVGGNAFEWTGGLDGKTPELRGNGWCGVDKAVVDPDDHTVKARWVHPDPGVRTEATGLRLVLLQDPDGMAADQTAWCP